MDDENIGIVLMINNALSDFLKVRLNASIKASGFLRSNPAEYSNTYRNTQTSSFRPALNFVASIEVSSMVRGQGIFLTGIGMAESHVLSDKFAFYPDFVKKPTRTCPSRRNPGKIPRPIGRVYFPFEISRVRDE